VVFSAFCFAAALLAIERVAYAWIWHRPEAFRALCRRGGIDEPVDALQTAFYGFKALQLTVFAAWCWHFGEASGWPGNATEPAGLLGLALIGAGQTLNASVFLRLGRVGVFYGNRLGHATEWREGFPFSLLDHPQYVGAVLSIWGLFLLARHPHDDWFVLPLLETVYYALGAYFERLPEPDAAADEG
jgi:methylene-fatty-acyl-phospholipid synthase